MSLGLSTNLLIQFLLTKTKFFLQVYAIIKLLNREFSRFYCYELIAKNSQTVKTSK